MVLPGWGLHRLQIWPVLVLVSVPALSAENWLLRVRSYEAEPLS
jgi:hypothetical protein